jgi:hypothetical protein
VHRVRSTIGLGESMRIRALTFAAIGALVVALSPVGSPAAFAMTPLKATITCDRATNTISTALSNGVGNFQPNIRVNVEFLVRTGSYVSSTTHGPIATGGRTTVAATTGLDGSLNATGYTRTAPLNTYLFYTETVRVSVLTLTGGIITTRDATCTNDLRTTVSLECDTEAHTITARASGVNYDQHPRIEVWYTWTETSQAVPEYPGFTRHNTSPPDFRHYLPTTGGAWSDVGYVMPVGFDPYYLSQTVDVLVWTYYGISSIVVGGGTATCVYADHRTA